MALNSEGILLPSKVPKNSQILPCESSSQSSLHVPFLLISMNRIVVHYVLKYTSVDQSRKFYP